MKDTLLYIADIMLDINQGGGVNICFLQNKNIHLFKTTALKKIVFPGAQYLCIY